MGGRLPELLPPETAVILDIDLDGFGTESPGAMSLADALPSKADLARIYHLTHNLCDIDGEFLEAIAAGDHEPACRTTLRSTGTSTELGKPSSTPDPFILKLVETIAEHAPAGDYPVSYARKG